MLIRIVEKENRCMLVIDDIVEDMDNSLQLYNSEKVSLLGEVMLKKEL